MGRRCYSRALYQLSVNHFQELDQQETNQKDQVESYEIQSNLAHLCHLHARHNRLSITICRPLPLEKLLLRYEIIDVIVIEHPKDTVIPVDNRDHVVMVLYEHLHQIILDIILFCRNNRRDHNLTHGQMIRGKNQITEINDSQQGPAVSIDHVDIRNTLGLPSGTPDRGKHITGLVCSLCNNIIG